MASGKAVFGAWSSEGCSFSSRAVAVNVHGFMRLTLDIDLIVKLDPDNIVR